MIYFMEWKVCAILLVSETVLSNPFLLLYLVVWKGTLFIPVLVIRGRSNDIFHFPVSSQGGK